MALTDTRSLACLQREHQLVRAEICDMSVTTAAQRKRFDDLQERARHLLVQIDMFRITDLFGNQQVKS